VGRDLAAARRAREELIAALAAGKMPASPRLRFDTVAGWWLARFEAKVAAGERHPRTLEAHRYHLEHNLLPRLASRRIAALGVEDVAALITELRNEGRSAKSMANALRTLRGILRFARRRGWVLADPARAAGA
jgi:site-specific recombinase XerD